jgi:hypothetical protein
MKKLAKYQGLIVFLMKTLGVLGIGGCVAEGHPYISSLILAVAAGLSELNTYIDKNK